MNIYRSVRYLKKKYKYFIGLTIVSIAFVSILWGFNIKKEQSTFESLYKDDWAIYNYGQTIQQDGISGIDINVLPAWNTTNGSKNILVAVVDTGIDISCTPFKNVNMLNGWDFYNNDATVYDEFLYDYHGTYIGTTIAKIAPQVSILPIKFMEGTSGTIEDAIKGINFAISKGAKIINCSWNFTEYNEELYHIIKDNPDVLFVCSAGNYSVNIDDSPIYPCAYHLENIINVLAIDNRGNLHSTSGYGKNVVDVAAPGNNVKVILPENEEAFMNGTSVAAAYVSAMAALILSANEYINIVDLKEIIISSAQKIESLSEKCVAGGLINIDNALRYTK